MHLLVALEMYAPYQDQVARHRDVELWYEGVVTCGSQWDCSLNGDDVTKLAAVLVNFGRSAVVGSLVDDVPPRLLQP